MLKAFEDTARYGYDAAVTVAGGALSMGKKLAHAGLGLVTTTTTMTQGPILDMVNQITSKTNALPEFVIHAGEQTYEICRNTADSTMKNVESTSGFIVTKVNGVVTAVSAVPVIAGLMEQLNAVKNDIVAKADQNDEAEKQNAADSVKNGSEELDGDYVVGDEEENNDALNAGLAKKTAAK